MDPSPRVHEIKHDGYRLQLQIDLDNVTLRTRNGHDWTDRFPSIEEAAAALPVTSAIIDGEAVCENERGLPDWATLHRALGRAELP
jgi:bifunctional non-homologous end joining protein LigD